MRYKNNTDGNGKPTAVKEKKPVKVKKSNIETPADESSAGNKTHYSRGK